MAKREPREGEGRPTHYSDEIENKAREYLNVWAELGHAVPSVAGLAIYLKRRRSVLYQWAAHADNEEFKGILEDITTLQEEIALSNGLTGDYNSAIVKLLLGKHGYSEKVETQTNVTFDQISDEELNSRIENLEQRLAR